MKRIFALILIIIMAFSSLAVNGTAFTVSGSADTVITVDFPVSYANQTATITVLKEGYDIDDVTEANKAEIVVSQVTETVLSTGAVSHTFNFDNLNQDYMFVATAGDIVMKQIINPYLTPDMQFNKIWLEVDSGTVTVSGRMSTKSPDGVTVKLMNSSASGPDDTQNIAHIMMAYIDSFGNISNKTRDKKGYTFETDESGDCTLYISYGGTQIYQRTIDPSTVIADIPDSGILNIDFELMEAYEPLSGTTKERFDQAVAELPKEIKAIEPVSIKGDYEIFVSPDGNDANEGSLSSPVKTIQKALELRNLYFDDSDSVVIYLRGGEYQISGTLNVSDTGERENGKPLIISSYNNEEVVLTNAETLDVKAFKKIKDQTVLERLPFNARNEVLVADLDALGLSNTALLTPSVPTNLSIYSDSNKLNIARWPNSDNVYVGEIIDEGYVSMYKTSAEIEADREAGIINGIEFYIEHGNKFPDTNSRPFTWKEPDKAWVTGHLSNDFTLDTLRIESISQIESRYSLHLDGYTKEGANATPLDSNGVATNDYINYYYFNVLEELDSPGEFYIDNENQKMYYYPDKPILQSNLRLIGTGRHVIQLTDATNVVINGIKIQYGSGRGISIVNGYQNLIQNVQISNMMGEGVVIQGGEKNGVIHSNISNNIGRAVVIRGNTDKIPTLTPSRNFIQNCLCYSSPLEAINSSVVISEDVGVIISHNLVMNSSAAPIGVGGNIYECIIEYNEVVGGPTNTVDSAGIYFGGNLNYRGNHVRYNYIHDLSEINKNKRALTGIYFDFCSSGNFAYGNIIKGVPSGLYSHNGHENVFYNNIIINDELGQNYPFIREELNALYPVNGGNEYVSGTDVVLPKNVGINELWARTYYVSPLRDTYFDYVENNSVWQDRYPTLEFQVSHLIQLKNDYQDEIASGLTDLSEHTVTNREVYLRMPYDAYYANNLGVALVEDTSSGEWYQTTTQIADKHIRLVGRDTNVVYVGDPFVDMNSGNFAFKPDLSGDITTLTSSKTVTTTEIRYDDNLNPQRDETYQLSTTIGAFVTPPFERMGLTEDVDIEKITNVKSIQAVSPGSYYDPMLNNNVVSLQWSDTGVSNYYKVSIADNAEFTNALTETVVLPKCQFDVSSLSQTASVYYWKVEALGTTKAYGDDYETVATFSFDRSYSDLEITDFTITPEVFSEQQTLTANAIVTNHMGSQVTPLILFASYDKNDNFISYIPVNDFTIDANQTGKSVGPVDIQNSEANISYVKLMIWNDLTNSLMPYGKYGTVYSK